MNATDDERCAAERHQTRECKIVAATRAALARVDAALAAPDDEMLMRQACAAALLATTRFPNEGCGAVWLSASTVELMCLFDISFSILLDRMDGTTTDRARA